MNKPFDNEPVDPEEEDGDVVELIDEEGNSTLFEHLATLEYRGESYLILCDPEAPEDDVEVFVMKIEQDENGQDLYVQPDEETAEQVFNYFLTMIDDADSEE